MCLEYARYPAGFRDALPRPLHTYALLLFLIEIFLLSEAVRPVIIIDSESTVTAGSRKLFLQCRTI